MTAAGDGDALVITAAEALALLSDVTGEAFRLGAVLTGGETGATAVEDAQGRPFVLKWEADPARRALRLVGVQLAERLRAEAGWPAPEQQTIDTDRCLFVLQTFMRGRTVATFDHAMVDSLFDLHERRLGMATASDGDTWADEMIEILVHGGDGYCLHEPLRQFDGRTRRIVERIEEIGRSLSPSDLDTGDIVHADLHAGNLLEVDGHLSAVIDMDYTCIGDADFDLTTLALSSLEIPVEQGVRDRLFERGVYALTDARRRAYVGGLLLRVLDWPIRKGRADEIELWVGHADELLPAT